jgi:hypothetical protein
MYEDERNLGGAAEQQHLANYGMLKNIHGVLLSVSESLRLVLIALSICCALLFVIASKLY